ncbi:DUF4062 domain-containing protein [Pseudomonas sp. CYM-20-01]|uniref:DUF4062 domain-containing protein n=1 Tax=Pseudomonas sp. CYM-20-01 TaxID=2870750 RepID=UPI0020BE002F|nr:DUF4062 domain-containing protein [Pseudomonas sp. CYM-20-01]
MNNCTSAPSAQSRWKTVRVFISSTFRDMHAERDLLVKVTFPRLRQWCEDRRLHLIDVDLRWGIPREEAEDGKVLEVCLQHIDSCRPFFVCLLGAQYGSLAQDASAALAGVESQGPYSVTHLEIETAALRPQEQGAAPEAFFYIRDSTSLPPPSDLDCGEDEREAYASTFFQSAPASGQVDLQQRLEALKQRIRDVFAPLDRVRTYTGRWDSHTIDPATPGVPGRLVSLDDFSEQFEADLKRAIEVRYADHIAQQERPMHAVAAEVDRQDAFVASRVELHVPDLELQERIDDYIAGDTPTACFVWGTAGSGKSAALCYWFARRDDAQALVVFRAAGASPSSTRVPDLLASMWFELISKLGSDASAALPPVPRDAADIMKAWPAFLQQVAVAAQRGVVVVVDGIDQLERTASPANWIPLKLPPGVRILVSTASDAVELLTALRQRHALEIAVPLMDEARCRALIRSLPNLYAKSLDESQVAVLLANPASRNPLFLTLALRELKLFGSFDKLDDAIARLPRPAQGESSHDALHRMFDAILARLEADEPYATREVVRTTFAAIGASRRGLSETGLSEFIAQAHPDIAAAARNATLQVVLRQMRPYLQRRQAPDGALIGFFHRSLAEQVTTRYLPDAATRAARRKTLAIFFEHRAWFLEDGQPDLGKATELPFLRGSIAADEPTLEAKYALASLMLEWELWHARHRAGMLYELAGDLQDAGGLFGKDDPLGWQLRLAEEALRRDIDFIDAHRDDYPQALLQCMWNSCWWYDHRIAGAHYADGGRHLPRDSTMARWAEAGRQVAERLYPGGFWLRELRPPLLRLGSTVDRRITGFSHAVVDIAWSPDGRFFVAVSINPAVRVFDTASGQECLRLHRIGHKILSVTISPDSQRFALGMAPTVTQQTIMEFSLLTGEHIATHKGHRSGVHKLQYSSDGKLLVACSGDGSITIWSIPQGELLDRIGEPVSQAHATSSNAYFDFIPGTSHFAWCSRSDAINVWDCESRRAVRQLRVSAHAVGRLFVSPDGLLVAFHCGYDKGRRLWIYRLLDGNPVAWLDKNNGYGGPLAWSPDSELLAMADSNALNVRIWHATSGRHVGDVRAQLSKINTMAFSPDGSLLATASGNDLGLDSEHGENQFEVHFIRVDEARTEASPVDHENMISALAYSDDGTVLVSTAKTPTMSYKNEPCAVRIWDAHTMVLRATRQITESIDRLIRVPERPLAITWGGCNLANEQDATGLRIWHWPCMRTVATYRFAGWAGVDVAADSCSFWLRHNSKSQLFGRYEHALPSGKRMRDVPGEPLAFSRDGRVAVVSDGSGKLCVLNAQTLTMLGETASIHEKGRFEHACFSATGDVLVHSDNSVIMVRDSASLKELRRLGGDKHVRFLGISDDGQWLTSAHRDVLRVWNIQTGECVHEYPRMTDPSAFARNPMAIAMFAVEVNGELNILHSPGGACVARLPGNWRHVCAHPDGRTWSAAINTHLTAWRLERFGDELVVDEPSFGVQVEECSEPLVPSGLVTTLLEIARRKLRRWFG